MNLSRTGFSLSLLTFFERAQKSDRLKPVLLKANRETLGAAR